MVGVPRELRQARGRNFCGRCRRPEMEGSENGAPVREARFALSNFDDGRQTIGKKHCKHERNQHRLQPCNSGMDSECSCSHQAGGRGSRAWEGGKQMSSSQYSAAELCGAECTRRRQLV